ncbi:TonB-dependent receptor family protein [Oxalicibacterium flavum]|nr:TonB-dependent receptor [Oxalicibacterium flavum]
MLLAAACANAEDAGGGAETDAALEVVDTVVVSGSRSKAAKSRVKDVPGNISVITSDELERGRKSTLGDVLAYQPGVFAESVGGNDAIKISIRGSGIISGVGVFREGIKFLFDGMPISGPGGTSYEFLNAQGTAYTEVLRGGNAFSYGALAIGGAVNFVTHTGYTAPGTRVRFEAGSWGLQKTTISHGGVSGDWDYYFNLDNYESDGYRERWSRSESKGLVANVGYRFSPKLSARALLRYREEYHQDPGYLTLTQLYQDPRQPAAANINASSGTRPGSYWGGFKISYIFDDDATLEVGLNTYKYPHINSRETRTGQPGYWRWIDNSQSIRYSRTDQWAGHESRTEVSYNGTEENVGQARAVQGSDNSIVVSKRTFKKSHDRSLAVGNDFAITPDLWLTSGLAFTSLRRTTEYSYHATNANPPSADYQSYNWVPRLGLRYSVTPDVQVFGNITRQIDPPLNWRYSIVNRTNTLLDLKEQKANTFEIGVRGQVGIASGSLVLFRTNVKRDLLTVVDEEETALQGGVIQTRTFNSESPTRRQGVELALDLRLWSGDDGSQVVWRNSYTWNDFRFVRDPRLGNNRLPGLPSQVYDGKVQYDHPSGFYGNLNVRARTHVPIDYTNSAHAPGYAVWGATFGYEAPDRSWNAYLDFKNLADRKYVATSSTIYDAAGNRDRQNYAPGDGFGMFAGVEYRF